VLLGFFGRSGLLEFGVFGQEVPAALFFGFCYVFVAHTVEKIVQNGLVLSL